MIYNLESRCCATVCRPGGGPAQSASQQHTSLKVLMIFTLNFSQFPPPTVSQLNIYYLGINITSTSITIIAFWFRTSHQPNRNKNDFLRISVSKEPCQFYYSNHCKCTWCFLGSSFNKADNFQQCPNFYRTVPPPLVHFGFRT